MADVAGLKVGQGRRLYVSAAKQSAYGTAAALTNIIDHPLDSDPLEPKQEQVLDDNHATGNVTDQPTSHISDAFSLDQPYSVYATWEAIGIFLSKCLNGGDTVAGGAAPYNHTPVFSSLPNFLSMLTWEEHMGGATWVAATDRKHLDLAIDSFELAVPDTGNARINLGLLGSGRLATGDNITEGGLIAVSSLLPKSKFKIEIVANAANGVSDWDGSLEVSATAGQFPTAQVTPAVVNISDYVESFAFRVKNNSKLGEHVGYSIGAGRYAGQVFPGDRVVEVEFKAKHGSATGLAEMLHAMADSTATLQKEYAILIHGASDTAGHGGMWAFPVCAQSDKPSGLGGRGILRPTYKWRARACTLYQPIVSKLWNLDSVDYH